MKSIYLLLVLFVSICVVFAQESITVPEATATTPEATATTPEATAAPTVAETPIATQPVTTQPVATTEAPAVVPTTTAAPATTSVVAAAGDCLSADTFSTTDFFPNKLGALDSSAQFSVTYSNTYKLVHNLALDEYYVLHCTKDQPDVGSTFQSKTFIQIPVRSFAAIDTRALGYLDLLGQSNNIAYVGNVSNVTSPCSNKTPVLFDVNNANLDRTLYDVAIYPGSANNDPKGVGLGVNYAASPLGNAQWVKYFALFTNQEVQAETIYNDIATDYNTFKNSINEAGHISFKRNVTFMNYDASSTRFNILQDQYFKNLTSDAGANLITPTVLQPADPSVMKGQLQNASLVIDLTAATAFQSTFSNWQSWLGYSDSAIANAAETALTNYKSSKKYVNSYDAPPFARNKQLWRLDLVSNQGALDYWTRGMARPDLVLQDLIQAQFPDYFKSRNRVFLRDFADGEATRTASSSDEYGCNLNNWAKAESVSYTNLAADTPNFNGSSSKLSLGVIIGVSVAGGMIALSCLVTGLILLIRKFKHNGSSKFTRLNDETQNDFNSGALDRDPMMMEENNEASGGRLGGSGRGL